MTSPEHGCEYRIVFIVPADNCEYIGIGMLSAVLKKQGIYNIVLVPAELRGIEAAIAGNKHCVLSFLPFSFCIDHFLHLANLLKQRYPHCVTVFGGPHATFAPEIIDHPGVDAVCRGEAEEVFPEFILALKECSDRIPTHIDNWWVKGASGSVVKNKMRLPPQNLDVLPFPDKSLFTRTLFFKKGFRRFIFSRGCLYRCAYCSLPSYPVLYGQSAAEFRRIRSVTSAIEEIEDVLRCYGGNTIGIVDPVFGMDLKWLEEFSLLYRKRIGLPFYCHAEVTMVSPRYAELLKQAGCYFVLVGLECANPAIRSSVLNKHFTNARAEAAAAAIREQGIRLGLYNMIGIPGSDIEDDLETLEMNQRLQPHLAEFHVFSLYPGIALYDGWKKCVTIKTVDKSPYWSAVTGLDVRKDLTQVIRLHYLFGIMMRWKLSKSLVRILTRLPLGMFYRWGAWALARNHYKRYDP